MFAVLFGLTLLCLPPSEMDWGLWSGDWVLSIGREASGIWLGTCIRLRVVAVYTWVVERVGADLVKVGVVTGN